MPLLTYAAPVLYAIVLWWFSTGIIMAVYGRPQKFIDRGFALASVVTLPLAFLGLIASRAGTQLLDVYVAVTAGVAIMGWHTASYYLGYLTGPSLRPLPNTRFKTRLIEALRYGIYHELLVIGTGALMLAITWSYANQWAFWMYLALWIMHSSAKINVFLGVRNFRIELLPERMQYVGKLIGRYDDNALFPLSVAWASIATVILTYDAMAAVDDAQVAGNLLVATMIALGALEHWLMVLPLPASVWSTILHHAPVENTASGDSRIVMDSKTVEALRGSVQ